MLRKFFLVLATGAALGLSFAATDALARGGSWHHGWHGSWHGGGAWHGGWHGHYGGYYGRGWGWGGVLLAPGWGAYAYDPYYYSDVVPAGDGVAYCMRRFRSYDPNSGTYLGYDGYRHPCP